MTQEQSPAFPRLTRYDRFFPLCEAEGYTGAEFLDMLIWIPTGEPHTGTGWTEEMRLRVWMRTEAQGPALEITGWRMEPVGRSAQDASWVDFGLISPRAREFGVRGFANLRIYGLTPEQARRSWVVFTPQTEFVPAGEIAEVERALCGLARCDAGRTTLTPNRAMVGGPAAFEMRYEVGPKGLEAGAFLRLAFPKAFTAPQVADPSAPGWLEVAGPGRDALEAVSIAQSIESHERIDVIFRLVRALAGGEEVRFRYRSEFVYLFPRRWAEVDRRFWWSHLPPMALAVAADTRQIFMSPTPENHHAFDVEPGPPERLHLFLPGRVRDRYGLTVHGVWTDHYRNPPGEGPINPHVRLRLDGAEPRELGSPQMHHDRRHRFRFPLPALKSGIYRVTAYDAQTGATLAESNPMEVMRSDDARSPIYWGEIHGHSEQSDGSGRYEDLYLHARDEGRLDFAAAADHACYHTDNEWQWMQDVSNHFSEDGRFVTLLGYEWAGNQGHRNVYSSARRLDLMRGMDAATCEFDAVNRRFEGRTDVVVGPHVHHGAKQFFTHYHPDVTRFFEICSMWGNYEHLAWDVLNGGARVGLTGGGDCHEARVGFSVEDPDGQGRTPHTFAPGLKYRCGITAALLPSLTRSALLYALRERRTYATTGPRILIDFRVNGAEMGGEAPSSGGPLAIEGAVHACGEIDRLEIVRDGAVVHTISGTGRDQRVHCALAPAPGARWLLLKVIQRNGDVAWTSPVWMG